MQDSSGSRDGPRERVKEPSSDQKLAELLLVVAHALKDQPLAGAVKINKIMFFGSSRTFGPPGNRSPARNTSDCLMAPLRGGFSRPAMRSSSVERSRWRRRPTAGSFSTAWWSTRRNLSGACSRTRSVPRSKRLSEEFGAETGTRLSEISHEEPAWDLYANGETIPFAMAFATAGPPSKKALERSLHLLRQRRAARA